MIKAYLNKELLLNLRQVEQFISLSLFGSCLLLLFHFATPKATLDIYLAIYLLQFIFCGILCLGNVFLSDEESGMLIYLNSAKLNIGYIWLVRVFSSALFLVIAQLIPISLAAIWYAVPIYDHLGMVSLVLILSSTGFCLSSFSIASIVSGIKQRSLILPVFVIPLSLPLFLSSSQILSALFNGADYQIWFKLLILYNLLFCAIGICTSIFYEN